MEENMGIDIPKLKDLIFAFAWSIDYRRKEKKCAILKNKIWRVGITSQRRLSHIPFSFGWQ